MSHDVAHATFTLERHYNAPPARVFAAWAGPSLSQWFVPDGLGIESINDFRVGGRMMNLFGQPGGPRFRGDGRYEDIQENARIVFSSTMHMDDVRASSDLMTVELFEDGAGTRLRLTDQSVYYMGDFSASRREGWEKIMGALARFVER